MLRGFSPDELLEKYKKLQTLTVGPVAEDFLPKE